MANDFGEKLIASFESGRQARRTDETHRQQIEENKLRTMVLKHEIDRMKIDDLAREQDRAQELATRKFNLLQGQPAADLPSEPVTTPTPDQPSRNLAGVLTGYFGGQPSGQMTGDEAPVTATGPGLISAPAAQPVNGMHPVTTMQPQPVMFPGVNGAPPIARRPQSREDMAAAAVRLKRAEAQPQIVGPEASLVGTDLETGQPKLLYKNPEQKPNDSEFGQFQQAYAESLGKPNFKALTPTQKMAAIPAFTKARQDPAVQQQLAEGRDLNMTFKRFMMAQGATNVSDRETQQAWARDHQRYTDFVSNAWKAHSAQLNAWKNDPEKILEPPPDAPEIPPFEQWRDANVAPAKPAATAVPAGGTRFTVGQMVTMKDGSQKKITAVSPDGTMFKTD